MSISHTNILGLALVVGIPITLIILIVVQHILGFVLSKNYDATYFKEPYFTSGEVESYSSWPLSLLRYATYIVFTGFPKILLKRRFKGHAFQFIPSLRIKLICQLWIISLVICILSLPVILLSMFILS